MLTHLLSAHLTKLGSLAILLETWNKHLEEYGLGFVFVPCSCLERRKLSHSVESDPLQPMDCSPPGSSVHGIFQARILEWVAVSYSRESSLLFQGLFLAQGLKLSLLNVLCW